MRLAALANLGAVHFSVVTLLIGLVGCDQFDEGQEPTCYSEEHQFDSNNCGCAGPCDEGNACKDGKCKPLCSNGFCEPAYGENCETCPEDCAECCGNGVCESSLDETCGNCPQDCGTATIGWPCCGNGKCDIKFGENCEQCPVDCECVGAQTCFDATCCTPLCTGLECGDDGCGGDCGQCGCAEQCEEGSCVSHACDNRECGPDGCGNESGCGVCEYCKDGAFEKCDYDTGQCVFVDPCGGRECGFDGCGGQCPPGCECGEECETGVCVFHGCDGKECGTNGCAGTCGECEDGYNCSQGNCKPGACIAQGGLLCGEGECCLGGEKCTNLQCCAPEDKTVCLGEKEVRWADSCGNLGELIEVCPYYCSEGMCVPCDELCAGKDCGWVDGCLCEKESCIDGFTCIQNHCNCVPDCAGDECGSDGCPDGVPSLGEGFCGPGVNAGVCPGDQAQCKEIDGHQKCICVPFCTDKTCGPDGCGGTCGDSCQEQLGCGYECGENGQCSFAACDGKVCGPDDCGGVCGEDGSCPPGLFCTVAGTCGDSVCGNDSCETPDENCWTCPQDCTGMGQCEPGTSNPAGCGCKGWGTQTCSPQCAWGPCEEPECCSEVGCGGCYDCVAGKCEWSLNNICEPGDENPAGCGCSGWGVQACTTECNWGACDDPQCCSTLDCAGGVCYECIGGTCEVSALKDCGPGMVKNCTVNNVSDCGYMECTAECKWTGDCIETACCDKQDCDYPCKGCFPVGGGVEEEGCGIVEHENGGHKFTECSCEWRTGGDGKTVVGSAIGCHPPESTANCACHDWGTKTCTASCEWDCVAPTCCAGSDQVCNDGNPCSQNKCEGAVGQGSHCENPNESNGYNCPGDKTYCQGGACVSTCGVAGCQPEHQENCLTCPSDCKCPGGVCVGNDCCTPKTCQGEGKNCDPLWDGCSETLECGFCDPGWTCTNGNCVKDCGNDVCDPGEDECSCWDDCGGPGKCCDASDCPGCGECQQKSCSLGHTCTCSETAGCCGNDECEEGENTCNCDADCDSKCGDGCCEPGIEDPCGCPLDCNGPCLAVCPNGECEAGECWSCQKDCGPAPCEPGEPETSPNGCPACQVKTRTCTDQCEWGQYSSCSSIGACTPGVDDTKPCEKCGTQKRTCGADCSYGNWGSCQNKGECEPDEIGKDFDGCGDCQARTRTCSNSCSWSSWSSCVDVGECVPGMNELEDCGKCGSRTRSCQGSCQYGEWSDCDGQGVCYSGLTQTVSCGSCKEQKQDCEDCQWIDNGACLSSCSGGKVCVGGECICKSGNSTKCNADGNLGTYDSCGNEESVESCSCGCSGGGCLSKQQACGWKECGPSGYSGCNCGTCSGEGTTEKCVGGSCNCQKTLGKSSGWTFCGEEPAFDWLDKGATCKHYGGTYEPGEMPVFDCAVNNTWDKAIYLGLATGCDDLQFWAGGTFDANDNVDVWFHDTYEHPIIPYITDPHVKVTTSSNNKLKVSADYHCRYAAKVEQGPVNFDSNCTANGDFIHCELDASEGAVKGDSLVYEFWFGINCIGTWKQDGRLYVSVEKAGEFTDCSDPYMIEGSF